MADDLKGLAGADLVERGLADLSAGLITQASLLVAVGGARLRALGLAVPLELPSSPEHRLFQLLDDEGLDAHSAFNALRRRLVSFQRALERERIQQGKPVA